MNLTNQNLIVTKSLSLFIALFLSASLTYAQVTLGANTGTTGNFGTFIGDGAGQANTNTHNTFVGFHAGKGNSSGKNNTYVGVNSGANQTGIGDFNSFFGGVTGYNIGSGHRNTFLGFNAGKKVTTGYMNTYSGVNAGVNTTSGFRNTYLGNNSGYNNTTGDYNVYLGFSAGYYENSNDKLVIDSRTTNADRYSPLIYGDFSEHYVGIAVNTDPANGDIVNTNMYGLYVGKGILTEKVKVATIGTTEWADYVFEEDYHLNSTEDVEKFVKKNKHLPNVPSAVEVSENGVDMVEMDATLLRQIEELWLHVIELKKENDVLEEKVKTLSNK